MDQLDADDPPSGIGAVRRVQQGRENFFKALATALRKMGYLVLPGVLCGLALAIAGELMIDPTGGKAQKIIALIVKDIGLGIIVAAIAVYGYEILPHLTDSVGEKERLEGALVTLEKASEQLRDQAGRLDPARAISIHLRQLFPNPELQKPLWDLIEHALQMRAAGDVHGTAEYERALGWMIDRFAVHNARQFAALLRSIGERDAVESYTCRAADPRQIAGAILAAQLRTMGQGDVYSSVANALFYEGGLMRDFDDAQEDALKRGVRIRRIFNVANFELDERLRSDRHKFHEARQRIHDHLRLAAESGGLYEVRFFGRALYESGLVRNRALKHEDRYLHHFPNSYFGVFSLPGERCNVLFATESPKLVEGMTLAFIDDKHRATRLFEDMWHFSAGAPNPFASNGELLDPRWLDGFVDALCAQQRPGWQPSRQ